MSEENEGTLHKGKEQPPLGVKIIAIVNGLNAVLALGIGVKRLVLPEQYVSIYPSWLIVGLLFIIGGLLSVITVGLWGLKRWAW